MSRGLFTILCLAMLTLQVGCGQVATNDKLAKAGFLRIFNGKDLTGWEPSGGAKWVVENGSIVGTQGDNYAHGDLFTKDTYKDFLLTATYKVEWPCNTGIWFRYQSASKSYQADILEYKNPECYSGSLYCPGKMFIAMNKDKTLVDREGWNTMKVRAEGDHIQIWLNGRQVANVNDDTTDSGKIGFQVHPGEQFGPMKIIVREMLLKPL
ncbi:MAG: 3-keto-disaccharide hydrolase [Planctomycetota bacterium]